MKFSQRLSLAFLLAALPAVLPALPSIDGEIEASVRQSYNFRVVLDRQVRVKADQGQVTLSGSVPDAEARALAQDTAENIPAVTGVTNNILVVPRYTVRSDPWIAAKVRSRLLVKANISAGTTYVSVQDGIASLGGSAATLAQIELTRACVTEIDGVTAVINNIVIKDVPASSEKIDDASVTTQVRFALLGHKSTRGLKTTVATTDGVVRVTGEAASDDEKSLVSKLVLEVRGTASVTNDMTVKG